MFDVWYEFEAVGSEHTVIVDPATSIGDLVVMVYGSCSGSQIEGWEGSDCYFVIIRFDYR